MKKRGFTLVELLIIVSIIAILGVVIIANWFVSSQSKAVVNSYKTSMKSVQTAVEMCNGSGITNAVSGQKDGEICGAVEKYPTFPSKCNPNENPFFEVSYVGQMRWTISTREALGGSKWSCRGCWAECSPGGCKYEEDSPGDCFE